MTAADRREELEALLWQRIKPRQPGKAARHAVTKLVGDVLEAADAYATALAAEYLTGPAYISSSQAAMNRAILKDALDGKTA